MELPRPGIFAVTLVAFCGVFGVVRHARRAAPTVALSADARPYEWGSPNSVKLFKRTHASTHPQRDGWFLSHYIGVEQTAAEFWSNGSQYSSKIYSGSADKKGLLYEIACGLANASCCAERASMTTLGTFTFHQFRSWVTPTGDARVEDWVGFWERAEGVRRRVDARPYDWDAYMHLATHFYTPNLDAHVRRLVEEKVPFLARHYANRGQAMFVAYVNNPFNGHVFAVHGARLKDDLRETYFTKPDGRRRRDAARARLRGGLGAAAVEFHGEPPDQCAVLEATLPTGSSSRAGPWATTRPTRRCASSRSAARDGGRPSRDYAAAADGNVKSFMGANEGWARFLDYHIGLNVPGVLDDYRAPLDAVDAHYHAHVAPQSGTPDDGSIFAEGASGLCVELHGVFNYTAFDPEPLGSLNFCAADSTCAKGVELCSGDVLHQAYPGHRVYATNASACDGGAGDCAHRRERADRCHSKRQIGAAEALMGFQFNEVGGGTRTRRPIALQMHYNAACDEPACYIMDERFSGGEPVDGGAPFERRATLAEARRFIEEENRRLERDQHRSFEAREIVMRVEYRHCPNLVLVDTPGLAGGGGDAREAYELALGKARARNAVLLCVDDGNDWKLGSIARRLCADADPTLSRTVVVSTKLDTKLVQFGSGRDVASFLRAKVLHDLHPRLLAGPFFTSVPCGRVAGAISPGGDAWDPQGGAPENQPWDLDDEGFYEDDGERLGPRPLEATDIELDALTPEKLRRSAETIADKFCRSLSAAVAGSYRAPRSSPPRHLSLPSVDGDEIANALGVGDAHDGADFVRASCVIAVDKARRSFEPQLQTLAERVSHVMRRLPPVIECMMESQPGRAFGTSGRGPAARATSCSRATPGPYDGVMQLIASIYDTHAHELADRAVARCKDDLEAMTRFVTWDLASSSDAKSAKKRRSKANKWFSAKDEVAVEASVLDDWKRSVADEDSDVALSSDELVEALAQPRGALSPVATPTEIVGSLVRRIAAAWREHFARTVAVKFNCFFLMPFVDDFPLYLREKLDDHVHTPRTAATAPSRSSTSRGPRGLEKRRDDLRNELAANAKLHDTFDAIQRACAETAP
ncbi:hypothetical protein JL720_3687 [Aureococcus anophagefferens]|nr:hypothetical protein JL720_3687 [Aureococcus anophagefferens]